MKVNISGTEFVVLENVKTVDTHAVVLKVKKVQWKIGAESYVEEEEKEEKSIIFESNLLCNLKILLLLGIATLDIAFCKGKGKRRFSALFSSTAPATARQDDL